MHILYIMPKLTVYKAINKFVISAGIKINSNIHVYYAWEEKNVPNVDQSGNLIDDHIMVDFDVQTATWYINYISKTHNNIFSSVDDITGRVDLST